jgi:hypothetical protein
MNCLFRLAICLFIVSLRWSVCLRLISKVWFLLGIIAFEPLAGSIRFSDANDEAPERKTQMLMCLLHEAASDPKHDSTLRQFVSVALPQGPALVPPTSYVAKLDNMRVPTILRQL